MAKLSCVCVCVCDAVLCKTCLGISCTHTHLQPSLMMIHVPKTVIRECRVWIPQVAIVIVRPNSNAAPCLTGGPVTHIITHSSTFVLDITLMKVFNPLFCSSTLASMALS